MTTHAASQKQTLAMLASDKLIEVDGVTGVCLFGSVARGQAGRDSDIDLLVVGSDSDLKPSLLYNMLPEEVRDSALAITYYTVNELSEYLDRFARFSAHLKEEGWIVYDLDGSLTRILAKERQIDPQQEVVRQLHLLSALDHTDRFGGRYLFPLAHVYRIGRTIIYAQLADRGSLEFDQHTAFRRLSLAAPEWRSEISEIASLEPFYARTRNRSSKRRLPFDPNSPIAKTKFRRGYDAVLVVAGRGVQV